MEAGDRLSQIRALGIAIARAFAKDGDAMPEVLRYDLQLAYREPPEA